MHGERITSLDSDQRRRSIAMRSPKKRTWGDRALLCRARGGTDAFDTTIGSLFLFVIRQPLDERYLTATTSGHRTRKRGFGELERSFPIDAILDAD
jgi:hypothetical protein